jgi:hypothetical protein
MGERVELPCNSDWLFDTEMREEIWERVASSRILFNVLLEEGW